MTLPVSQRQHAESIPALRATSSSYVCCFGFDLSGLHFCRILHICRVINARIGHPLEGGPRTNTTFSGDLEGGLNDHFTLQVGEMREVWFP